MTVLVRRAAAADMPAVATYAARLVRLHHSLDPLRFFVQEPVEEGYRWWLSKELRNSAAVILVATTDGAAATSPCPRRS